VDADGAAYIAGETQSYDFPITPTAPRRNVAGFDTFAAKLDPSGSTLVYSTYLGCDSVGGIGLAPDGAASVTGTTFLDLATTPDAVDSTRDGIDGYVVTLASDGSQFVYGSYLGARKQPLTVPVSQLPKGPALKCEESVASELGDLARGVVRCHVQLARAALPRRSYDSAACEAKTRARYDAAVSKLSGCPACVEGSQAGAANRLVTVLRAFNAEFYRRGTQILGSGVSGFVPPTRQVLRCENALAREGAALFDHGLDCQGERARGKATCTSSVSYPLFRRRCPRCLHGAVPVYRAGALVNELAGRIFCAGTPLPFR